MNTDSGEFHIETQLHICEKSLLGNMVPWDFKNAPQYAGDTQGGRKKAPPAVKAKYASPSKPKAKKRSMPRGGAPPTVLQHSTLGGFQGPPQGMVR